MPNDKVERGGNVLKSLMESLKKIDEVPALAAKEKYSTWDGKPVVTSDAE